MYVKWLNDIIVILSYWDYPRGAWPNLHEEMMMLMMIAMMYQICNSLSSIINGTSNNVLPVSQVFTYTSRLPVRVILVTMPNYLAWLHCLDSPVWGFITTCMETAWERLKWNYPVRWSSARVKTRETCGTWNKSVLQEKDLERWAQVYASFTVIWFLG